jgi:photosystem II stability/assembly factor-like uncharacterized protein
VVGENGTILYTTDGGVSWNQQSGSGNTWLNSVFFIDENTGWIAGGTYFAGLILKTFNGGVTWDTLSMDVVLYDLCFINADTGWVSGSVSGSGGIYYRTFDGGITWNPDTLDFYILKSIHFTNVNTGSIVGWADYDLEMGAIFTTTDGGNTWSPFYTNYYLNKVEFSDQNTGWLVGKNGCIFKTWDNGISWQKQSVNICDSSQYGDYHYDFNDLHFINPDTGWVVGNWFLGNIIIKTTDGGYTWEDQHSAGLYKWITSVYFIDEYTGWIGTENGGWTTGSNGDIRKTTDGGNTWFVTTYISRDISSLHFVNEDTGWAVGNYYDGHPGSHHGDILRTVDGGNTWNEQLMNPQYWLKYVYFINSDIGWVVGNEGVMLKTNNSGVDWIVQNSNTFLNINSIFFINPDTGWAVGGSYEGIDGLILYTEDGGLNWLVQSSGLSQGMSSVFFINEQTGWAVGSFWSNSGTILKTNNGGNNWFSQSKPSGRSMNSVFFVDPDVGWTVGYNGAILKTTNGGGIVSIKGDPIVSNKFPQKFTLSQNYPNPFNPITTIEFNLPKNSEVALKIFNILGEEVATLVSDRLSAGSYTYEWDASNLASGIYLYRLQAGSYIETRKMVLMW